MVILGIVMVCERFAERGEKIEKSRQVEEEDTENWTIFTKSAGFRYHEACIWCLCTGGLDLDNEQLVAPAAAATTVLALLSFFPLLDLLAVTPSVTNISFLWWYKGISTGNTLIHYQNKCFLLSFSVPPEIFQACEVFL